MRSSKTLIWGAMLLALVLVGVSFSRTGTATTASPSAGISLPIETVADYVHAVIEADREVYTRHVVERMESKGMVVAAENWMETNTLPLPIQFLMESGRLVAKKGTKIRYRLISLWPINKQNAASTEFERIGLGTFITHITQPNRPYVGFVELEGGRYFQAIYADRAVTQACIGCHNAHPTSPKRDFKPNDVMGGIVISIPLS